MSRRLEIRSSVISGLLGHGVRAIDLILNHHVDQSRSLDAEVLDIERQAAYLIFCYYFGEETVHLMDSSKFKLPKKLEESGLLSIRRFLDREEDPHAANRDD